MGALSSQIEREPLILKRSQLSKARAATAALAGAWLSTQSPVYAHCALHPRLASLQTAIAGSSTSPHVSRPAFLMPCCDLATDAECSPYTQTVTNLEDVHGKPLGFKNAKFMKTCKLPFKSAMLICGVDSAQETD